MTAQKPLVIEAGVLKDLPSGNQLDLGAFALPATDGTSGQTLQTNGAGVVAWTSPTGGPPTGAAGPTYLSGTYPDPDVVGLGEKVVWLVEGGKYASLQAAFDAASEGDTIMVGPKATGTWGDLTIAENKKMSFVGMNGVYGKTVKIGAITFSPSTGGLNILRNEHYFENLFITGSFASQAVLFSGTGAGRMRFAGCYVDNTSTTGDGVVNSNTFNTGASSSLYLDNCVVQVSTTTGVALRHSGEYTFIKNRSQVEGGLHAIEATAGIVEIVGASVEANGALSTVEVSGSAFLSLGYSTVRNSSDAAGAIGVNVTSPATFGAGDATISVGSSVAAAGTAVAGTGAFAYTGISFSYASAITVPTANQSQALSTTGWISTKIKQGISLTSPGSGLLEFNTSGRLNRYNDAVPTNGQLLIGDTTAGYWKAATITAGSNVSVTNGAGSITIAATGTVTSISLAAGSTGLTFSTDGGGTFASSKTITSSGTFTFGGTLAVGSGGTGLSSYAVGDLVYASGTTTLAKLADVATGNALISGGVGVAPSYGKIGLTTHVSGTLPVANGGTGTSTAFTQGSVVFAGASGVYSQNNTSLFWDNTNSRLGLNTSAPTTSLDVRGTMLALNAANSTTAYQFQRLLSDSGTATGTQTSTTLQDTSKTWTLNQYAGGTVTLTGGTGAGQVRAIVSNTASPPTLTVTPAWTTNPVSGSTTYSISGPASTLLDIDTTNARLGVNTTAPTASVDVRGTVLARPTADSTTAFQVQNSASTIVLDVDTTNQRVGVGKNNPTTALDVVGVITASTGVVTPIQRNTQTTSYTLALSDASKMVEVAVTSPSTATVTVPLNTSVAFPVGAQILIAQTGTGTVSIAAAGGVTINYRTGLGLNLNGQWAIATLVKRATDTWILFGDLV